MKKPKFLLLVHSSRKKQHNEVGLDGNVYNTQAQAASSLSFEPVLSIHCLAALDLGAGVK